MLPFFPMPMPLVSRTAFLLSLFALAAGTFAPAVGQSMFTDPRARETGDVLTIILAEQTAAQRESEYSGSAQSSLGGSGSVTAPGIGSRFSGDAQISTGTDNRNETVQSDLLEGRITARIVGVDAAGNLQVEGERRLNVKGVTHVMTVTGIVRPLDVRFDNTVLSPQIANANIVYDQTGGSLQQKLFSKQRLLQVGSVVALGLGIFLGIN